MLPLVVLALVGGLAYFHASGRSEKRPASAPAPAPAPAPRRARTPPPEPAATVLEPPSGPSPTANTVVDTPYERELRKRLESAGGQADAIEALVGAYKGEALNGVGPTEQDRMRARRRGCWMLKNADIDDPRRAVLDCGNAPDE